MDWVEFIRQNQTAMNLKFMWSKPKHPNKDWKGYYSRWLHLWVKYSNARLYVPISLASDAGYIDLNKKSMHVTSDIEGSEAKIKEVYVYLTEHAR